jgi:hypothetical protein
MYKDRSTVEPVVTESKSKKSEFVNLDEISEGIVQNEDHEDETSTDD